MDRRLAAQGYTNGPRPLLLALSAMDALAARAYPMLLVAASEGQHQWEASGEAVAASASHKEADNLESPACLRRTCIFRFVHQLHNPDKYDPLTCYVPPKV